MIRKLVLSVLCTSILVLSGCQYSPTTQPPLSAVQDDNTAASDQDSNAEKSESKQPESPVLSTLQPSKQQKPAVSLTHQITINEQTIQTPSYVDGRLILGINETATLPDYGFTLKAKLDTGAENSSVDARNIQYFERDGDKWVKFNLHRTSQGTVAMELPLQSTVRIKRPGLTAIERPVVNLTLTIGDIAQSLPVSLTDRSKYSSPLLVGRNFMQDMAVIDVSKRDIATRSIIKNIKMQEIVPTSQISHTRVVIQPVKIDGLATLGAIEKVTLVDEDITVNARIDSGALTSTIDARNLTLFQKDGADWVQFDMPISKAATKHIVAPVTRFVLIKRHGESSDRRPVITLDTKIGDIIQPTQFTLRDRSNYDYPILIGLRFLENKAVVDVSKAFIAESKHGK